MININEVTQKIKAVGVNNVRIVTMDGQPAVEGLHQIDINSNGQWITIATGMKRNIAEDIVRQATNKVILG